MGGATTITTLKHTIKHKRRVSTVAIGCSDAIPNNTGRSNGKTMRACLYLGRCFETIFVTCIDIEILKNTFQMEKFM